MKTIKFSLVLVLALALVLSACGGGGGSPGATGSGSITATGVISPTVTVNDFTFELSKSTIKNSGADSVVLTVTALNTARTTVVGAVVSVAVDSGGVFSPGSTLVTDSSGRFIGNLSSGGDKTDRAINATIAVNGVKKMLTFAVTGSQISITPVPAVPKPGETVTFNIKVSDSASSGIANIPVQLSDTVNFTKSLVTDVAGNASFSAVAPQAGNYSIVANASGVSMTSQLRVVASGVNNSIPLASPTFSGANLLSNPASIPPNIAGSTLNRSVLTAKFIRQDNSTVENMRVRFEIVPPVLGAGESISTGDALTYSDSSGVATSEYISGQRTSPTNGVAVRICFDYADFAKTECPNSRLSTLTVSSKPLDISIGNFNKSETIFGGIGYVEKFLIQVADSSGLAVSDAVVSMSVDITHFGKGNYGGSYYQTANIAPTAANLDYPTTQYPDVVAPVYQVFTIVPNSSPTVFVSSFETYSSSNRPKTYVDQTTRIVTYDNVWCVNEDRNRNAFKDGGEDINNNGLLEPSKSEIVLSYVSGNKTDAEGRMLVQVTYPQNMATWLAYTLKATTSVVGSQGSKERSFITKPIIEDIPNGSFRIPPFGRNRCIDSN
jgi:hypothetical protein